MIYFLILILLIILTIQFDVNGVKTKTKIYWFLCFIFVFILGLRYRVGGDTLGYIDLYKPIPSLFNISTEYLNQIKNERQFGFLWSLFCSTCKTITESFIFFQFIHATFLNIIIFYFILKNTTYKFTNILFYFIFYFLHFNTEILRESLAICIFLLSFNFYKKKWLKYFFLVFIAIQFHISAVILLLVPLFGYINRLNYKSLLIVVSLLLITTPLLKDTVINNIVLLIDNKNLQLKILNYASHTGNFKGVFFSIILKVFFPLLILYIDEILLGYKSKFRVFIVIYILFSLLTIYVNPFHRFSNYFIPFYYIFMVDFLAHLYKSEYFRQLRQQIVITFFIILFLPQFYYYFQDTSDRVPDTRFYNRWYPYYTVFSKKKDNKRELVVKTYDPSYKKKVNH